MFAALSRTTLGNASRTPAVRHLTYTSPSLAKKSKTGKSPKVEEPPTPSTNDVPSPAPVPESPLPATTLSLDFSPAEESRQTTGAKSSKTDSMTSGEKQRRAATRNLLLFMGCGALAHIIWMGSEWEEDELQRHKWTKETAPASRWERTKIRYSGIFEFFADPISKELLPPPFPPPDNKPFTLVVSLDDLLIHSSWDRQHGWRTAKRPGVDYFLGYLSQFYEIVVFTDQMQYTAEPIVEQLDKYRLSITHHLYRDSTRAINGVIAKDLSYLNRDLAKVIVLDTNESHVRTHPENAIIVPKWTGGKENASGLVQMIPFLEHVAFFNYPDVRQVLQNWHGKNIPVEYAKWEAEYKQRHLENMTSSPSSSAGSFSLGSLFSSQRHPQISRAQVDPRTLSFIEIKRAQAQHRYIEEQKYWAKQKPLFDKMIKEQEEQMKAQMPGNLWEIIDMYSGKPKEPPTTPSESSTSSQTVPVT